ncbi:siderophore-interacting protein [Aureimonas jatrophae]|uniref:NADPH-dependent ferric siderophore reductase, contains FAD-binding and SIP domains n=1 Tax=Aureimonas jatrophae TaxID=1166073 RepID=A0A1H0HWL3_9HYPH|nr:siderophore-interacting protein [Aureimonas jatrophae]MBB3950798.1 NADPH-dependent ferric siderophore reductase [Aureimonas jatrophae]SDO23151.1 NADPH-dependent ferric siderophore reductase, contains FAD-binding and SIP domains [Aureimonas jatrophae]
MLEARSTIVVPGAERLFDLLCEHFAEHGEVRRRDDRGEVSFGYGTAVMAARPDALHVEVAAANPIHLSYLKIGIAEHLLEFHEGEAPAIAWIGDGLAPGTPLPWFRELTVAGVEDLTPHMRRVRLRGEDLAHFAQGGYHVYLLFPPKDRAPVWPVMGETGLPVWPQGDDALTRRVYTIRSIDVARGELAIDIVTHAGEATPGSDFARSARPGDIVGITGPGGGEAPDARRLVLAGDDTALPAIARILEDLPPDAEASVILEVDGPADAIALPSRARTDIRFHYRWGAEPGTLGRLPEALRSLDWDRLGPDVFVWAACEFADFKAIRRYLRQERGLPRDRHMAASYWRRGRAGG